MDFVPILTHILLFSDFRLLILFTLCNSTLRLIFCCITLFHNLFSFRSLDSFKYYTISNFLCRNNTTIPLILNWQLSHYFLSPSMQVKEDEPVLRAFQLMQEKGIGGLPVVDGSGKKAIGNISVRDVQYLLTAPEIYKDYRSLFFP